MAVNTITEEVVAHTKQVTVITCDVCSTRLGGRFYKCYMCSKDLCYHHTVYDNRDSGDYPDKYCQPCWDIGESYRLMEAEAADRYYDELDKIHQQWKAAATKP